MTTEQWAIVIGAVVAVLLAVLPWAFAIHGKLAKIVEKITNLVEQIRRDREEHKQEHTRLWGHIDKHDERLNGLDKRTTVLEQEAGAKKERAV